MPFAPSAAELVIMLGLRQVEVPTDTLELVRTKIAEIKSRRDETRDDRWTEADTESRAIRPLLESLGYDPMMYTQRRNDGHGYFPDYTLLPHDRDSMWFLESKAWGARIDRNAAQVVNYATNNGADWAVITDGLKWRIYEAHAKVPLEEKLVAKTDSIFDDEAAVKVLSLLSVESIKSGRLRDYATRKRASAAIVSELQDPQSPVATNLEARLRDRYGILITKADIVSVLSDLFRRADPAQRHARPDPKPPVPQPGSPLVGTPVAGNERALSNLMIVTRWRSPRAVVIKGREQGGLRSWRDFYVKVIEAVLEQGHLPIPFTGPNGQRLIDVTGAQLGVTREIRARGGTYYAGVNRSADDIIQQAKRICEYGGVRSEDVILRW